MNPTEVAASAYETALSTIRDEHHALALVMEVVQRVLTDIGRQHAEPDFALLAAALYYIDDFPERYHHPKEDQYLFDALRRHTTAFNETLDELQADHVRSGQMMDYLHHAFVHYQAGAPQGYARFRDAIDAYGVMLREHMDKEEHLLADARECLDEQQWQRIAAAFAANDDPLFGANAREAFRRLYLRIINLLPRKRRPNLHHHDPEC